MDLYTLQYILYAAGLVFSAVGLFIAMRRPPTEEQKLVMAVEFFAFAVQFGYWGAIQRPDASLDLLIFATKLEYIGACNVYLVLMLMYVRYFHKRMPVWLYWLQIAAAVSMTLLTVTFDRHHLFYRAYHVATVDGMNILVKEYGPLHAVYIIMVSCYTAAFTTMFFCDVIYEKKAQRRNCELLYMAVMIPSICYLLEKIFNIQLFKLTPFGITATSCICLYLLTVRRFCDVKMLAQNMVYDSIDDALVVLDMRYHLQQCNKLAMNLFPFLSEMHQEEALNGQDSQFEQIFAPVFSRAERFPCDQVFNGRIYLPEIKAVYDKNGKQQGSILWLKDVSAEREKEKMLQKYSTDLEEQVAMKTHRLTDMQDKMIEGFSTLAEDRNLVTGKHLRRTSSYVLVIAEGMKFENMYPGVITDKWIETLWKVAPLHDIGKISTQDSILDKPSKLTSQEFEVIKMHTTNGAEIIQTIMKDSDEDYMRMAGEVARSHHERWDGTGYPQRLAGEEIPLSARIMAVADVFDALVSERPYKRPYSAEEAFAIIEKESGSHFDPNVVKAFIKNKDQILEIYEELQDWL
jgi:response regulator RpfG family c-di-GMP phosphodiesterase